MIDYWNQLLDNMQQQADTNLLSRSASQQEIVKNFFKPIIKYNEKIDQESLEQYILKVKNNVRIDNKNITIENDESWKELVLETT